MGCGSSSLKGEKVDDIKAEQPQPIKKVRTNFTEVDFTGESGHRRGTVAVAPDEQRRPTTTSDTAETGGILQTNPDPIPEEPSQQAYVPVAGETNLGSPTQENPALTFTNEYSTAGTAPTTTENVSTTNQSADITNLSAPDDKPRRKSWLSRFNGSRNDSSVVISDEELKKQTGMSRAEFDAWKEDPKNKVGKHQLADDGTQGASLGATVA